MKILNIKHLKTQKEIYKTACLSSRSLLEQAIADNVDLTGADLRYMDLRGITLDETNLNGAAFDFSNLSASNLSGCDLQTAQFNNTCLIDACLCESALSNSSFLQTRFGATDIHAADMDNCKFSGLSCFSLEFIKLRTLKKCAYHDTKNNSIQFSSAPIVIHGLLSSPLILFKDQCLYNGKTIPRYQLPEHLSGTLFNHNNKIDKLS